MIKGLYEIYLKSSGVSTDTRSIQPDNLFFALRGDQFDGNKYAEKALDAGALAAVIDDESYHVEGKTVLVDDTLLALQYLARCHRDQLTIPVVGITGSNGKTTTKELLLSVLSQQYRTYATRGNLNNHIGVPLSILDIDRTVEIAVIEMGANHQGEIDFLCSICKPDYGLITNIGKAHLEGFGGIEGVKKGKSELYRYLAYTGGTIFVDETDSVLVGLLPRRAVVVPCIKEQAYTVLETFPHLDLKVEGNSLKSKLTGIYNVHNILMAVAVGKYFDVDTPLAISGISNYIPTNNRSQVEVIGTNTYILDAYNANPTSMSAAIVNMQTAKSSHKVLILGDMLELGDDSQREHREIMNTVESMDCWTQVYTVGPIFASLEIDSIRQFLSIEQLNAHLHAYPLQDSLVLVKGSRSIHLEKLLK